MAQYWMPLHDKPPKIAASLSSAANGVKGVNGASHNPEPTNPTVIPATLLFRFQLTFLIRHPRSSIPSYYRCTVPPLAGVTGFHDFRPEEAGYAELRRLFDHACQTQPDDLCLIDADDLLDNPAGVVEAFCGAVGLPYSPAMLKWDSDAEAEHAAAAFAHWEGWHDDALDSKELRARTHVRMRSDDQ